MNFEGDILLNSEAKHDLRSASRTRWFRARPSRVCLNRITKYSTLSFSFQAATRAQRGDGMPHSLGEGGRTDGRWLRVSQRWLRAD